MWLLRYECYEPCGETSGWASTPPDTRREGDEQDMIQELRQFRVKCDGAMCGISKLESVTGDAWSVMADLTRQGWSYYVAMDTVLCPKCTTLLRNGGLPNSSRLTGEREC